MNNYSDPQISWTKTHCPACKNPTGPESRCYEKPTDTIAMLKDGGMLNIFSESCIFRRNNMWDASINYPFTLELLNRISEICGINKVSAIEKYRFQISISPMYDEMEVKKNVTIIYNAYVKEFLINVVPEFISREYKIVFPNSVNISLLSKDVEEDSQIMSALEEIENGVNNVKISVSSDIIRKERK